MKSNLPDAQNKKDIRNIIIDKVGIKDIRHPVVYIDKNMNKIPTVGNFTMTTTLPKHLKGTHMSRFVEVLNEDSFEFNVDTFHKIVDKTCEKLDSKNAHVALDFIFFRTKKAPATGVESIMDYKVNFYGENIQSKSNLIIKVEVPVTSLCPCSKSVSDRGAHNQRSNITIKVRLINGKSLYIEDLIDIAEKNASCDLYSILKREDEKVVTERAYDNPAFVEDLVRDIAIDLNKNDNIDYYRVESENFESIHNHSAYALIENNKC
jgi:GTP cyclohydrolase I